MLSTQEDNSETNVQDIKQEVSISLDSILDGIKSNVPHKENEEENVTTNSDEKEKEEVPTSEESEKINELDKLKSEIEELEKRRKGSQKQATELSQKLKTYQKKIAKYTEEGLLGEEDAQNLLNDVLHDDAHEEEQESDSYVSILRIGNKGIDRIRQSIEEGLLDEDEELDEKVKCFDMCMADSSTDEKLAILDELVKVKDDPVRLAKKMINIGKSYYDDVYKEVKEVGSLRQFKAKHDKKVAELQKKIDNKDKEILRYKQDYEGFIPSKDYRLSGGSGDLKGAPKVPDTSIDAIIHDVQRNKIFSA